MSVTSYKESLAHVGHKIVCITYGKKDNVSFECEDCNEVILSFDRPAKGECELDGDITNDCEGCAYSGDYHYDKVSGECVERGLDNA